MSGLMHGKRGLIMGVANDHSIAWGIAKTLAAHGAELADDLERVVAKHGAETIAAVVVEPMAGSTGVLVPPVGYLERLRALCDRHGILLVFDEVITGFGRLGAPFAANRFGVTPEGVYTHYPPGPEYLLYGAMRVLGPSPVWHLRLLPIAITWLATLYFGLRVRRRFGPAIGWMVMAACMALPSFSDSAPSLHYEAYGFALLLVEIALCLDRRTRLIPFVFIGFLQGWLSFDYSFLVALTPGDVEDIGGDRELARDAFELHARLDRAVLPGHRIVEGTAQPTTQSLRIRDGVVEARHVGYDRHDDGELLRDEIGRLVEFDLGGDGTVYRYSTTHGDVDTYAVAQQHAALPVTGSVIDFARGLLTGDRRGARLGGTDVGLDLPDRVPPGTGFDVVVRTEQDPSRVSCLVEDAGAETLQDPVRRPALMPVPGADGVLSARVRLDRLGLYRVKVGGGGDPVTRLVMVA